MPTLPSPTAPISKVSRARTIALHAGVAAGFVGLAIVMTWPLVTQLSTHIPGLAADDNAVFLWNFWWARHALAHGLWWPFHTTLLFYPEGTNLLLHSHTALSAFVGATMLGRFSIVTAQNLVLLAAITLNGWGTYLLAWRLTGHRGGAIAAGVFFAICPYFSSRLYGHYSLAQAWGLPLFVLTFSTALTRRSVLNAAGAAIVLAAIAFTDYYLLVYAGVLALCVIAARWCAFNVSIAPAWIRLTRTDWILVLVAIVAIAASIIVPRSGGWSVDLGPFDIAIRSGLNLRAIGTAAILICIWRRWRPWWSIGLRRPLAIGVDARVVAVMVACFAVLILPLVAGAFAMWRDGQYVSHPYLWRSVPKGVDPATLLLGNQFHPLLGPSIRKIYDGLGMAIFESTTWLGLVPMAVLFGTRRCWLPRAELRPWFLILGVFVLWALGPFLTVFGVNTGLPLPAILLRYVPIVANARIPTRAMVVVYLAVAILLASAIASSRIGLSRRMMAGVIAAMLLDFGPAPFPTTRVEIPPIFNQLAALPPGAVLPIPFGVRDGFDTYGLADALDMYYQSAHGKPLVGGYVSRLSPELKERYRDSPVFAPLFTLSANDDLTDADAADMSPWPASWFADRGIRYVVINRATSPDKLTQYVKLRMPMVLVASSETHEIYEIK